MSDENSKIEISLGKETDKAVGEILRNLLSGSAKEIGNVFENGIGIFGDRIRKKRELNLEKGLEETKRILDQRSVKIIDITPTTEEETHQFFEGMSLSGDDEIRNLWSALLANALDPAYNTKSGQDKLSVLRNLTLSDVVILEFICWHKRREDALSTDLSKLGPLNLWGRSGEESENEKQYEKSHAVFVSDVNEKVEQLGLMKLIEPGWSLNLDRLGLTRLKGNTFREFDSFIDLRRSEEIEDNIKVVAKALEEQGKRMKNKFVPPENLFSSMGNGRIVVELSAYGLEFAKSCGLVQ